MASCSQMLKTSNMAARRCFKSEKSPLYKLNTFCFCELLS